MPPNGFKTISLPVAVMDDVQDVFREIAAVGTRCLPEHVVPPEYRDKVPLTLAMVIRMGALTLKAEIEKKRRMDDDPVAMRKTALATHSRRKTTR